MFVTSHIIGDQRTITSCCAYALYVVKTASNTVNVFIYLTCQFRVNTKDYCNYELQSHRFWDKGIVACPGVIFLPDGMRYLLLCPVPRFSNSFNIGHVFLDWFLQIIMKFLFNLRIKKVDWFSFPPVLKSIGSKIKKNLSSGSLVFIFANFQQLSHLTERIPQKKPDSQNHKSNVVKRAI